MFFSKSQRISKSPQVSRTLLSILTNLHNGVVYMVSTHIITIIISRGARGVMVIVADMDTVTRVQNLDETDCISHNTNNLGKGMNLNILPPAMGK